MTHSPQTHNKHTSLSVHVEKQPCNVDVEEDNTCNLYLYLYLFLGTCRLKVVCSMLLGGGHQKNVRMGKRIHTASMEAQYTLSEIRTHTKEAPPGLYNPPGRDRIHTHEELRE